MKVVDSTPADCNSEKSIRKNKLILSFFSLSILLIVYSYILLVSTFNGHLSFRYVYNSTTGEASSILSSIICYGFILYVLGAMLGCPISVLVMMLYFFLHRHDDVLRSRYTPSPKYEEELHFACGLSLQASFVACFILGILHISGLITIPIG